MSSNGLNESFTYDRYGNLYYGPGGPQYTYDSANHLTAVGTTNLSYDAAGNLISDSTDNYAYDGEGRLSYYGTTTWTGAEYFYNALGERVERYNGSLGWWETIWSDPWGHESSVIANGIEREDYLPRNVARVSWGRRQPLQEPKKHSNIYCLDNPLENYIR